MFRNDVRSKLYLMEVIPDFYICPRTVELIFLMDTCSNEFFRLPFKFGDTPRLPHGHMRAPKLIKNPCFQREIANFERVSFDMEVCWKDRINYDALVYQ